MIETAVCMYDFFRTGSCYYPNTIHIDSQTGKVINNRISKQKCSNTNCPNKKIWDYCFSPKTLINQDISFKATLTQLLDQAYSNEETKERDIKKEEFDINLDFIFQESNKIRIFFNDSSLPAPYINPYGQAPLADSLLKPWQKDLKDHPITTKITDNDRLILWNLYSPFKIQNNVLPF